MTNQIAREETSECEMVKQSSAAQFIELQSQFENVQLRNCAKGCNFAIWIDMKSVLCLEYVLSRPSLLRICIY